MCRTACLDPFSHVSGEFVDLPCGCQDVVYMCGCVCREHNHLHCDGLPVARTKETA